ncbi:MAG: hypothetical protein KGH65_05330 [Candidatus Micrarchaeota archaeon]|nr:hypothetical protein [Candidatus Micrarchaeota archaeon]
MGLKVVIVSPKYQNNLGYLARVADNFGITKLHIVRPRAKLTGKASIMYSKHAYRLVENAAVYKTFEDAIKDCEIVIGTTGIWRKGSSGFRKVYLPSGLVSKLKKIATKKTNIAIVIGRDDTGLSKGEMERCNLVTYIPTNPSYPVLNISHALAIMLFVLTDKELGKNYKIDLAQKPDKKEMDTLFRVFDESLKEKRIRNKSTVRIIFRRLITIAQPTQREVHAMITAFKD